MKKTVPFELNEVLKWRDEYKTPFYIYDEKAIRDTVRDIYKAFSWNEGFKECFAVKACPTPGVLRVLKEEGCGMDCASIPELEMARRLGLSGDSIMFTANEITKEEYEKALSLNAIINLDDRTQVDVLSETGEVPEKICVRYNPGEFQITNSIMGSLKDSKFGMTKDQVFETLSIMKEKGVKHFGMHAMLASCSLEEIYYPRLSEELFSMVLEIKEKTGITLEFIDLAGGIGIPYRENEEKVDIIKVGEGVKNVYDRILKKNGIDLKIYTEMGRFVTGPYGYLVTSVVGKKHIYREYVGVDASASCLMRPAIYNAYHHITVLGKTGTEKMKVDVVGALCENNDKFAVEREIEKTEIGDILVIHDAGAHGHSMGYNYNGRLRPAEFLMHENHEITMIRRKETVEDYFKTLDIDTDFMNA